VALKFCTDPVARQRLLRHEAKVLDRVMRQGRHPGIVRLEATYLSADPPCLQYEYVSGGDLGGLIDDWHRQPQKPSPERVAQAMLALAEIVAFAHRTDPPIVHRDLKPANILVEEPNGGEVAFKITDFGIGGIAIARAVQASRVPTSPSEFLTTAVRGSGTFLYASPEQLNGHDPDPRDDVHALGVIWYQMLTGDLTKGRPGGTAWRRRFLERGLSAALLDLLESCFEDREDRPADAGVMADRLGELLKAPVPAPSPQIKRSDEPAKEIVNSIGMKLKLIPAGEFMMGSDATDSDAEDEEFIDHAAGRKEKHRVRITKPFYLGIHQVTRGQFRQFVDAARYQTEAEKDGEGGYGWNESAKKFEQNARFNWLSAGFDQTDDHPVVNVSWNDAQAFIGWLSQKEGTTYRLPTEAEWEYACRAGTTTRYSCGHDPEGLAEVGNIADGTAREKYSEWTWTISARDGYVYTSPVGRFRPNKWGLYDMHGNVGEWCSDWFAAEYYKQSPVDDPQGATQATHRVHRGGGWGSLPLYARSASRIEHEPGYRCDDLGFRLALVQGDV
jgi:sulfatase modifying factor 1